MPETGNTPEVKIGPFTNGDQGSGRPTDVVGGSEMDTPLKEFGPMVSDSAGGVGMVGGKRCGIS